ncbi:hypothetical protein [Flavivirga spongiicola]|uniref:Outer membrane protein beta-barrel domain-containing protein n=1 Tax=Flavivirga spongiicola TaxID=421621 RepID=A0ABU7XQ77_9FLAO|nr:hypothetical protein [Flavivirga sp. MEBiC05379]MDO5977593.1 hypothetical protein [Flavivirga sp. MEBiC05379]
MNKKSGLIIVFLLYYSTTIFSQEIKTTYRFDIPVYNKGIQYREGHKVKIIDTSDNSIKFVYIKFKKEKVSQTIYNAQSKLKTLNDIYYYDNTFKSLDNNDETEKIQVHTLAKSTFLKATSRYYYYHRFKGVKAGLFTVPFKLRFDDFDFEQNVNLGMSVSFRFRLNRKVDNDWLISPTLGIGLSTIKLNPKNSNLIEGEDSNRSASAFSLSGGILLELKETINLSFQYGFDFLGNDDKDIDWKYNRQPWLGIGINIGFPISKNSDQNENDKN